MANIFFAQFWAKIAERRSVLSKKYSGLHCSEEFARQYLSICGAEISCVYFTGDGLSEESYCHINFSLRGEKYETEIYAGSPAWATFSSDLRKIRLRFRFRLLFGLFKKK